MYTCRWTTSSVLSGFAACNLAVASSRNSTASVPNVVFFFWQMRIYFARLISVPFQFEFMTWLLSSRMLQITSCKLLSFLVSSLKVILRRTFSCHPYPSSTSLNLLNSSRHCLCFFILFPYRIIRAHCFVLRLKHPTTPSSDDTKPEKHSSLSKNNSNHHSSSEAPPRNKKEKVVPQRQQ